VGLKEAVLHEDADAEVEEACSGSKCEVDSGAKEDGSGKGKGGGGVREWETITDASSNGIIMTMGRRKRR
jgi:hypothetical protein